MILRLCKGVIHIFDVLFTESLKEKSEITQLCNVFLSLKNTLKIIFSLSKEKKYDKMFIEENLIIDLLWILTEYVVNFEE